VIVTTVQKKKKGRDFSHLILHLGAIIYQMILCVKFIPVIFQTVDV